VETEVDFYTFCFDFRIPIHLVTMPSETDFVRPIFAGVDVGGTNVKIGLVDDVGRIVAATKFPTQPGKSPEVAMTQARKEFERLVEPLDFDWEDLTAVGLGTPGPMDIPNGVMLTPVNLLGWHHFPVRDRLANALEKSVTYANDAGAAAFGEFWVGGGQAYDSMVLLTLGTGVGGGIIINEICIDGANSHGAEIGHMTIDTGPDARMCGCGQFGHLEAYASATAVVERTREALGDANNGANTVLRKQPGEASPLSALMISDAAAGGDEFATSMVMETAVYLGRGIAQLAHIIDPAAFILGGAMNFGGNQTELGRRFLDAILAEARRLVFPVLGERMVVKFAELGSEAGFVGAAGLARAQYNREILERYATAEQ
jgi:glucokinase